MQHDIESFNVCLPLTIRRCYRIGIRLFIHFHPMPLTLPSETLSSPVSVTRNDVQRFFHFLLAVISLRAQIISIDRYKPLTFGCLNGIIENIGRVFPFYILCPMIYVRITELSSKRVGSVIVFQRTLRISFKSCYCHQA